MKHYIFILALITLFSSCSKDDEAVPPAPEIIVKSPYLGESFDSRSIANIEFDIQSEVGLKSYYYEIVLSGWPGYYKKIEDNVTGNQQTIKSTFTWSTTTFKAFGLTINVVDINNNSTQKTIGFSFVGN